MGDKMAQRQQHSKSRKGCLVCKRRHIKCDEQGPPCANCHVRNLDCTYGEAVDSVQNLRELAPKESSASGVGDRHLELELILQWATDTYRSLVFQGDDESVWREAIPRTALDFDYLLNDILALSALHSSTMTTPTRSRRYQLAAIEYQNLAITGFRAQVLQDTAEVSQSMCAFSILNLVLAVAFPAYLNRDIGKSSIFDNLTTIFSLLQGTHSIISSSRASLLNGPLGSFVRQTAHMQCEDLRPNMKMAFENLRVLRDEEYVPLLKSSGSAIEAANIYEGTSKAIEMLEVCFSVRSQNKLVICFRWFATLEAEFVKRIMQRNPLALLITMHWTVLLADIGREKWWARSSAKALVGEISSFLSPQKPEWRQIISSVHREVGLPPC